MQIKFECVCPTPPVNSTRNAIGDGIRDAARADRRSQQQLRIRSGPQHQDK